MPLTLTDYFSEHSVHIYSKLLATSDVVAFVAKKQLQALLAQPDAFDSLAKKVAKYSRVTNL